MVRQARGRFAEKLVLTIAAVTLGVSIIGLAGTILLNAFVFDKYDAYGEVPIPGTATLHLPAGEVTITLHTYAVGSGSGGGLPIPQLSMNIDPPPGVADPDVVENFGGADVHYPPGAFGQNNSKSICEHRCGLSCTRSAPSPVAAPPVNWPASGTCRLRCFFDWSHVAYPSKSCRSWGVVSHGVSIQIWVRDAPEA